MKTSTLTLDEFIEEVISDFGQYHSIDKSMYSGKASNPILESLIAANRDFRDIDSRVSKIEALIKRKAHVYEKRKADYEAAKLNWKHPLNSLVEPERKDWKL